MCIYTVKKQKKKKIPQGGGCATPPNVPKLGVSGVIKDIAKTNKDIYNMTCLNLC